MARGGVPIPKTEIIYDLEQLQSWSECEALVAKRTLGYWSDDVLVFDKRHIPSATFDGWLKEDGHFVIQPFIRNPKSYIWRVDIVDGEIIRASMRYPHKFGLDSKEYPICNGHNGGRKVVVPPAEIDRDVAAAAKLAVSRLNLDVAGVDILIGESGAPYVCEANPDLEASEGDPSTAAFTGAIARLLVDRM